MSARLIDCYVSLFKTVSECRWHGGENMKKVFLGAATLALLSTSAYATKARLLALGDEIEDNYYTMDDRYIFTNASFVNNFGDMVVLEYGQEGVGSGSTSEGTCSRHT